MYSVFLLSSVKDCFKSKEFHNIFKEMLCDLKCCLQRIKKGYCRRDLWNINDWFLNVIPDMLEEFRDSTIGTPLRLINGSHTEQETDRAFAEWKAILTQMAFLFRESNEETCKKKNPYAEEHAIVFDKFIKRFGFNGKWVNKKDGTRVFIRDLSDIPKYKALDENYCKAEEELSEYRINCRKKAMSMFAEYFNDLWD